MGQFIISKSYLACFTLLVIIYQVRCLKCFICVPDGDDTFIKQRREQIQAEFMNSVINCSSFEKEMNMSLKVKDCPKSFRSQKCLRTIIEVNGTKTMARECDERYEELESDSTRIMSGEFKIVDENKGIKMTMRICTTDECNSSMDMMESKGLKLNVINVGIMTVVGFVVKKFV